MTRSELLETNTVLRDAVGEIAELVDTADFVGQASMDMGALEAESERLQQLLHDIGQLITDALEEAGDDETDDDDDADEGD